MLRRRWRWRIWMSKDMKMRIKKKKMNIQMKMMMKMKMNMKIDMSIATWITRCWRDWFEHHSIQNISKIVFHSHLHLMFSHLTECFISFLEWYSLVFSVFFVYLFQRLQMLVVDEILFFRSECIKRRWRSFNRHKWFILLQF